MKKIKLLIVDDEKDFVKTLSQPMHERKIGLQERTQLAIAIDDLEKGEFS